MANTSVHGEIVEHTGKGKLRRCAVCGCTSAERSLGRGEHIAYPESKRGFRADELLYCLDDNPRFGRDLDLVGRLV